MNDEVMIEKVKKAGDLFIEIADYFKSDLISARMLRADITVLMKRREELTKQNAAILEENERLKKQADEYFENRKDEARIVEEKARKMYSEALVARETKKIEKENEKVSNYVKSKVKDSV